MTQQEIEQAIQMHESGVTWELIAAHYKTTLYKLRKQIKTYETTT